VIKSTLLWRDYFVMF